MKENVISRLFFSATICAVLLASSAADAQCVAKGVMSDEELEACRTPQKPKKTSSPKQTYDIDRYSHPEVHRPYNPPVQEIEPAKRETKAASDSESHKRTPKNRESTLDTVAKGAVAGAGLGLIGLLLAVIVFVLKFLFRTTKKRAEDALPKVKAVMQAGAELAKSGVQAATAAAHEASSPTKNCPFCAEKIKAEAIVCKHCKRDL